MNTALLATYGRTTVPMLFVGPVDSSAAEYEWIAANVPDASVIAQSLINHGGRFHDVLRVASPAGVRDYHFDVTPFMGLPTRAAGAVGLPTHGATPPSPAAAPELYRRRSDGAVFRVGWQGRCMDGPVQLVPLDGGEAIEVRYPVLSRDYDSAVATRAAGAVAPAGDAATDLLTGVLGPLASSGQLDRVVDRLGNQLIDRLLSQPEVQRNIGDAIGKAAVKELSQGVGKPYVTTVTVAAGIGAASLLAIAVLYAARK